MHPLLSHIPKAYRVRRPSTAYMLFTEKRYSELKGEFDEVECVALYKLIALEWKHMCKEERGPFLIQAAEEYNEYLCKLEAFDRRFPLQSTEYNSNCADPIALAIAASKRAQKRQQKCWKGRRQPKRGKRRTHGQAKAKAKAKKAAAAFDDSDCDSHKYGGDSLPFEMIKAKDMHKSMKVQMEGGNVLSMKIMDMSPKRELADLRLAAHSTANASTLADTTTGISALRVSVKDATTQAMDENSFAAPHFGAGFHLAMALPTLSGPPSATHTMSASISPQLMAATCVDSVMGSAVAEIKSESPSGVQLANELLTHCTVTEPHSMRLGSAQLRQCNPIIQNPTALSLLTHCDSGALNAALGVATSVQITGGELLESKESKDCNATVGGCDVVDVSTCHVIEDCEDDDDCSALSLGRRSPPRGLHGSDHLGAVSALEPNPFAFQRDFSFERNSSDNLFGAFGI